MRKSLAPLHTVIAVCVASVLTCWILRGGRHKNSIQHYHTMSEMSSFNIVFPNRPKYPDRLTTWSYRLNAQ